MPYVNIKITNEGASSSQKAALIGGVTELLVGVLGKDPATTFVVIDEVETEHWGIGGLPVEEYRRQRRGGHDQPPAGDVSRVIRSGARLRTVRSGEDLPHGRTASGLVGGAGSGRAPVRRRRDGARRPVRPLRRLRLRARRADARRRQAAEDITQEVFVSLWEHPERIESGRGTLRGFLGDAHPPPCGRRRPPGGGAPASGGAGGTGGGRRARHRRGGAPVGHDRQGPHGPRGAARGAAAGTGARLLPRVHVPAGRRRVGHPGGHGQVAAAPGVGAHRRDTSVPR